MRRYDFRSGPAEIVLQAPYYTATGKPVFFNEPYKTIIDPRDLYIHLTHQSRYAGAIHLPILLHLALCVKIAKALGLSHRLVALCAAHDLHEAYCQDLTSALKRTITGYIYLEDEWSKRVHEGISLDYPSAEEAEEIKLIDLYALWIETLSMGFAGHVEIATWVKPTEKMQAKLQAIWKMMPNDPEHWMVIVTEAINGGGGHLPALSKYPKLNYLEE